MNDEEWLTRQFEGQRRHLRAVAFRILGSVSEADDAVQDTWLRLQRTDTSDVENLAGWLTTVVARVSLNVLRSRDAKRETALGDVAIATPADATAPEDEAVLADSVGVAMLVVLETLSPGERVAFVLHDMFGVPFDELAGIVGTSSAAARQLASRARRRVRGSTPSGRADDARRREIVDAFLAASRRGDFAALLAVLDPDVVLRADEHAVRLGSTGKVVGAEAVVAAYTTRARGVRPAIVDGLVTFVAAPGGRLRAVFDLTVVDGRVTAIEVITDPGDIAALAPELLPESTGPG